MNHFTPRISTHQAKSNGFVSIIAIILLNDLLTAAALVFVFAGRL